jgi:hypothetical protein
MDEDGDVPCQPAHNSLDPQFTPTLAFVLGRMRHLVSIEKKTKHEAATAVAGALISDCARKNHSAKSSRAISRQLESEYEKVKVFKRKLIHQQSGTKKDEALRERNKAMLRPMDVRADGGGNTKEGGARARDRAPREAFTKSMERTSCIDDRSPYLSVPLKEHSPYMNTRLRESQDEV